jgi:hypothetical protein
MAVAGLLLTVASAQGQTPTLTDITLPKLAVGKDSVDVTLTGTGFMPDGKNQAKGLALRFIPADAITTKDVRATSDTSLSATFKFSPNTSGTVAVIVHTDDHGDSQPYKWDTGIAVNECLEAIESEGCVWRWEVAVSGISDTGSQNSGTSAAPNIMTTLNYQRQFRGPTKTLFNIDVPDHKVLVHARFGAGYTQIVNGAKVQSTNNPSMSSNGSTSASTATSSSASNSNATAGCPPASNSGAQTPTANTCNAAITQQAFVGDVRLHLGLTMGQDGSHYYSEAGVGARASLQALTQQNQVIQSGGLSYIALNSLNPKSATFLYGLVSGICG